VKISRNFILAGCLAGALTGPGLIGIAGAHGIGNVNGPAHHNFCYDKHGRWRSHPHCPAAQPTPYHRHYVYREPYRPHYHPNYYDARDYDQRRPPVIYVRKDAPYDYRDRYSRAPLGESLKSDARSAVKDGREQLRSDRAELKKDRAELRRDIRNRASKDEIKADRQEIRDDLQKIKATRQEIRSDRRELAKR
jgi:hypothetical protein